MYTVMQACYNGSPAVQEEAAYWIGGVSAREGADYLRGQLRRLEMQISGLRCRDASHPGILVLEQVADTIKAYLSVRK